jgi:hypothetical protein
MRQLALFFGVALIGCDSGAPSPQTFGLAAPASGTITMKNQSPGQAMSGVTFQNQGTGDVTIDQIHFVLASGQTVDGAAGVGVPAGQSVTYLYDTQSAHAVASLSFAVHGTTESLVVLETQQTGVVPGPACSIAATSYDQSCTQDADCVPVFQGSVCTDHCGCANAAINQKDLTQYQTDLAATAKTPSICECPNIPAPRCVNAVCSL